MPSMRQQAILDALGITQWVPKAASITMQPKTQRGSLWRLDEQPVPAIRSEHNEPDSGLLTGTPSLFVQPDSEGLSHFAEEPLPPLTSVATSNLTLTAAITTKLPSPQSNKTPQLDQQFGSHQLDIQREVPVADAENPDDLPRPASFSLRLQCCEINQWLIMVNEHDLQQPAQLKLWQNILLAFDNPSVHFFSWPLSEGQRWQHSSGVKAALSGFLFKMGLDKRIGLMSPVPDENCPDRIERLPHLQELLNEPLKKRLLWNLLK